MFWRILKNSNSLQIPEHTYYYPYAIGMKTGFTSQAKNCLIAASKKDNLELISIVLHAEQTEDGRSARYCDTISLLEYGYNNYVPHYEEEVKEETEPRNIETQGINNKQEELVIDKNSNQFHLTGFYIFIIAGILMVLIFILEIYKYFMKKDGIRYLNS